MVVNKMNSPLKAIRKFCLQCGDGTRIDVQKCNITRCPLYEYRFGVMPGTKANRDEKRKLKNT